MYNKTLLRGMAMQDNKSNLVKVSNADKVKRGLYVLPVKVVLRWWLRPAVLAVNIWHTCGGTVPSKTTVDWLAENGTKKIIGKIRVRNGEE